MSTFRQIQNGGRKHKVGIENARKALQIYQSGKTLAEAAKAIGVTPVTLAKTLERFGLRLRYQKPKTVSASLRVGV